MNYRIFALPAIGDDAAQAHLNGFLAQHKVIMVDRQFVAQGDIHGNG